MKIYNLFSIVCFFKKTIILGFILPQPAALNKPELLEFLAVLAAQKPESLLAALPVLALQNRFFPQHSLLQKIQ